MRKNITFLLFAFLGFNGFAQQVKIKNLVSYQLSDKFVRITSKYSDSVLDARSKTDVFKRKPAPPEHDYFKVDDVLIILKADKAVVNDDYLPSIKRLYDRGSDDTNEISTIKGNTFFLNVQTHNGLGTLLFMCANKSKSIIAIGGLNFIKRDESKARSLAKGLLKTLKFSE